MSVAVQTMEKDKMGLGVAVDPAEADGSLSDDGGDLDSQTEIRKPGPHDVLLGRGGGTNNHSGNIKFRQLVRQHKMRYLACSKVEKPKVAREVVQMWRKLDPPGRFLQRRDESKKGPGSVKDASNVWVEVNEKKAREKASQCLRERTEDVLPYLSHLRQQQDQMTEQGVSQVQRQLQMSQAGANNPDVATQMRRNSLVGMGDRPAVNPHGNRRGSMPVAGSGAVAGYTERRTSMPAASHLHSQQQQQQQINMQLMARQQQVLRDAYTVIERSNGMQAHQHMVEMQSAMGQQHLLAERQALMQQQYANFEGQMAPSNLTPQERMIMQNNLMAQQSQAMGRAGVPGMMSPAGHQQGMNMAMMANNSRAMSSLSAGMHNMQMQSPVAQHRLVSQQLENMHHAAMPHLGPPGPPVQSPRGMHPQASPRVMASPRGMHPAQDPHAMNPQTPRGMHPQQDPRTMAPQSPHVLNGQQRSNMPFQQQHVAKNGMGRGSGPTSGTTPPHPVRDIHVPLNSEDLEPLPYGQDESPVPDTHKSAPPRFVSPNIVDRNEKRQADSQEKPQEERESPRRKAAPTKRSSSKKRLADGTTDASDNLNPLPVDRRSEEQQGTGGGILVDVKDGRGGDSTLKEYRKTLEEYITNHQISTPAVDIDDDASDEGGGFEGIDASAWIQQALNDSADLSLSNNRKNPAGGRRGLMKEHRENSKKSLMSTGTGDAGSCMSIALSDMEESVPLRDHSARDAPTRSSFSNRSISSELTDFSELDCL